jgi:transposase-like protein
MEFRREAVFAGETEGARRATGVSPAGAAGVPDPAVEAKAKRRRFTAEYKLRILREVERAKESGEIGAILRREGLYSSLLAAWRRDRDRVAKTGLAARKRGPKAKVVDPRVKELEREIAKLRRRNERVELLLSIQKKASELLGIPLNPHDPDEND